MSNQLISIEQEFRRFEKIRTEIFESSKEASTELAKEIAELIKDKATKGEQCVLGLATGSSPTGVYNELIRLHKDEGLSFKNVVTFNLDEYYPMQPETFQSYVRFMKEYLFNCTKHWFFFLYSLKTPITMHFFHEFCFTFNFYM